LYPPLSIGLGLVLAIMEVQWLKSHNPLLHPMARFWDWKLGPAKRTFSL
jgi:cytochrome bd-type quinol oxidase subunit 1